MVKEIRFIIHAAPRGKDRPRQSTMHLKDGRVISHFHSTKGTAEYEELIRQEFVVQVRGHELIPKSIPLKMEITAYFPIPKSTTRKNRQRMLGGELLPTKKPDADNIAKIVEDALNKIAYEDDSQITDLSVKKLYVGDEEDGYVEVYITSIGID